MFLFASRTDTFGQVILEAQASGLPVVAVAEGGPTGLIDDGRTGRLCPADADALAAAVLELARSPRRRAALGQRRARRGRRRAPGTARCASSPTATRARSAVRVDDREPPCRLARRRVASRGPAPAGAAAQAAGGRRRALVRRAERRDPHLPRREGRATPQQSGDFDHHLVVARQPRAAVADARASNGYRVPLQFGRVDDGAARACGPTSSTRTTRSGRCPPRSTRACRSSPCTTRRATSRPPACRARTGLYRRTFDACRRRGYARAGGRDDARRRRASTARGGCCRCGSGSTRRSGRSPTSRAAAQVVYAGRLSREKGVLDLLEAAALPRATQWPLQLVGCGPIEGAAQSLIRRRVARLAHELRAVHPATASALAARRTRARAASSCPGRTRPSAWSRSRPRPAARASSPARPRRRRAPPRAGRAHVRAGRRRRPGSRRSTRRAPRRATWRRPRRSPSATPGSARSSRRARERRGAAAVSAARRHPARRRAGDVRALRRDPRLAGRARRRPRDAARDPGRRPARVRRPLARAGRLAARPRRGRRRRRPARLPPPPHPPRRAAARLARAAARAATPPSSPGCPPNATSAAVRAGRSVLPTPAIEARGFVAPGFAYTPALRRELDEHASTGGRRDTRVHRRGGTAVDRAGRAAWAARPRSSARCRRSACAPAARARRCCGSRCTPRTSTTRGTCARSSGCCSRSDERRDVTYDELLAG